MFLDEALRNRGIDPKAGQKFTLKLTGVRRARKTKKIIRGLQQYMCIWYFKESPCFVRTWREMDKNTPKSEGTGRGMGADFLVDVDREQRQPTQWQKTVSLRWWCSDYASLLVGYTILPPSFHVVPRAKKHSLTLVGNTTINYVSRTFLARSSRNAF